MIVVSLPPLAPLFRRYVQPRLSEGSSGQNIRSPQIAEHTIGSGPSDRRDNLTSDPGTEYNTYMVSVKTGNPNVTSSPEIPEIRLNP